MMKIIVYLYLFCFALSLHGQVSMTEKLDREFNEQVKEMKIKSLTEWTFSLNPSHYARNAMTYQANFDSTGHCTHKVWFQDSTSMNQEYYWYDDEDRLSRSIEAAYDTLNMTHILEYKYNSFGNLTHTFKFRRNDSKDSLIDRIEFSYNQKNQLVKEKRYYSSSDYCYFMDSITYNKKGNISNSVRFKNATKNNEPKYYIETEFYYYDRNDNLVSKIIMDERDKSIAFKNEYLYDKKGRLIDSRFFQDDNLIHCFTYIYNKDDTFNFMGINQNRFKYVYENGLKKQVILYNIDNQPSIAKVYDYEFY